MKRLLYIIILLGAILISAVGSLKWRQISDVTTTLTEINYIHGLTSAIQTQLNAKPDTSEVNLIINNINPHDSVWFKDETYNRELIDSLVISTGTSRLLLDLKRIGSAVVSVPYGATTYGAAGSAITSGRVYAVMHVITDTTTVTGVEYGQSVATPNFYARTAYNGFEICSYSEGVITQIAQTVSDSTIFKTYGYKRKAFPAPITLNPGIYYVRALWQASTVVAAPSIALYNAANVADLDAVVLGTSLKTSFYRSSQTSFVTPYTVTSGFGASLPVALNLYYTAP